MMSTVRPDAEQQTDERASRRFLFFVSTLVLIAAVAAHYSPAEGSLIKSGLENLTIANHLAENARFESPFDTVETGPSAHVSPGFPVVVALLIKAFGNGTRGACALKLLTSTILGLQLALIPLLASRLRIPPLVGLIAALFQLAGGYVTANWEVNYVALLLVVLAIATLGLTEGKLSIIKALALGALWSLIILFGSIVVISLPLYLAWLVRFKRIPIRSVILLTFTALLLVSPWLIRNYVTFHKPVFIRDNLGLELATSNNPCATYSFTGNVGNHCYQQNHPNGSLLQGNMVRTLGELEYNNRRLCEGLNWVKNNSGAYATLCLKRFCAFWFPWEKAVGINVERVTTWVLTLLSIWGLRKLSTANRAGYWYLLIWLLTYPLAYYLLVAFEDRHRIPIIWATSVPGTWFFYRLFVGSWYTPAQSTNQITTPSALHKHTGASIE